MKKILLINLLQVAFKSVKFLLKILANFHCAKEDQSGVQPLSFLN